MGKKWIALLLALALLAAMTACGKEEEEANPAGDTGETQTSEPADSGEEPSDSDGGSTDVQEETPAAEEEDAGPMVSVQMEPDQQQYTDDDGTVLCYANLTEPKVSIEDNTAAADAVNGFLSDQTNQRRTEAQNLTEQARANRAVLEESGGFYGFSINDTVTVGRVDSQVVSLLWSTSYYTGGAHGSSTAAGWAFDVDTGEQLDLDSLTGDPEALTNLLTDRVTAEIAAAPDNYFPQAADQVSQLLETGSWYLSDEGLVLLAAPELLAPYAAGTLEFLVSYSDLADVLDAKWLPDTAAVSTGEAQIALTTDDGAPDAALTVRADQDGTRMVLWSDGDLENFRIWRVSSIDGVTWYRGACCYAVNRLKAGTAVGLTAMLPDVMTNTMVSWTAADGSTVYRGVNESGKDGSVSLLDLDQVVS